MALYYGILMCGECFFLREKWLSRYNKDLDLSCNASWVLVAITVYNTQSVKISHRFDIIYKSVMVESCATPRAPIQLALVTVKHAFKYDFLDTLG